MTENLAVKRYRRFWRRRLGNLRLAQFGDVLDFGYVQPMNLYVEGLADLPTEPLPELLCRELPVKSTN